jgi:hypothetical protein
MTRLTRLLVLLLCYFSGLGSAWATTFYTDKSGSDANSCATAQSSTPANGKLTIGGGLGCLSAGDTLLIGDGTYAEELSAIISSTSYASATQMAGKAGASSAVIIKPSSGTRAMTLSNDRYIIISDIIFDGDLVISDAVKVDSASDHIRFTRVTFRNGTNQGLLISDSSFVECLTCTAHTNGSTSSQHGIYIGNSDDCLIQGGEMYGNAGGGVHIASGTPQKNIIENIRSHDNLWGIVDADESGNIWRNNVVYDNTSNGGNFISLSGSEVYNNTFYGNGGAGFWSETDTTGILYKNNISYGNTGAALTLQGSGHTQTTNLATDPSFTNAATGDFTLQSGSAARDTGTDLSSTGFADDIIGTARPQNGTWDKGAYEYVPPPPASTIGLSGSMTFTGSVTMQ